MEPTNFRNPTPPAPVAVNAGVGSYVGHTQHDFMPSLPTSSPNRFPLEEGWLVPPSPVIRLRIAHPEIAKGYEKIMLEQYELFSQKMADYGTGNIAVGTKLETPEEVKLSLTGLYFRMNDKINRLKQLVALNKTAQVSGESVEDTFKDLSVYGIIAQLVLNGKWK